MAAPARVLEGDNIDQQAAQLPQEISHWQKSSDGNMYLIDDKTGAVLDTQSGGGFLNQVLNNPDVVVAIAAAAAIPGMAEALGPSIASALNVSTALGNTIAGATLQAGVQVAAGVPVDTAIKNAAISTVVSTGANDAATSLISQGNNPAAVNSITSGVAGAVQTAANGGNVSQILENAGAGAAASLSGTIAQNVGVSPTMSNVVGGTVGGALQAGGGAMGAAIGAITGLEKGVIPPNSVAVTLPDGSTGYMTNTGVVYNKDGTINQGSSVIPTPGAPIEIANQINSLPVNQGEVPVTVIQDIQTAGPGGAPPPLEPGRINIQNGQSFFTYLEDGTLKNIPVSFTDSGRMIANSLTDEAILLQQAQKYGVSGLNLSQSFLDYLGQVAESQYGDIVKKVLGPGYITQAEGDALLGGYKPEQLSQIAQQASEANAATDATEQASKLSNLVKSITSAFNPSAYIGFLSALGVNIPSTLGLGIRAGLFSSDLNSGEDAQLAQILKNAGVSGPFDPGTGNGWDSSTGLNPNIPNYQLPDVTVSASRNQYVIGNIDPATNIALLVDYKGNTTIAQVPQGSNKGDTVDFTDKQNPINITQNPPSQTTKTKTDANIYPGSVLQPKQTTDPTLQPATETTLQPATQSTNALPQNLTPSSPGYGYSPASFNAPEVSAPGKPVIPGSTTPTTQEIPVGPKSEGSYGSTSAAPYDPNLFIYGNAPKGLGTIPQVLPLGTQAISGQTQGTSGVAGQVSVESPEPQKAVWNTQSLKLKSDAEQPGSSNYDNLSTALGI